MALRAIIRLNVVISIEPAHNPQPHQFFFGPFERKGATSLYTKCLVSRLVAIVGICAKLKCCDNKLVMETLKLPKNLLSITKYFDALKRYRNNVIETERDV